MPLQRFASTIAAARKNPFYLNVPLSLAQNQDQSTSQGFLVLDDGDSLNYGEFTSITYSATYQRTTHHGSIESTIEAQRYTPSDRLVLEELVVLGVPTAPTSVQLPGYRVAFSYDAARQVVSFHNFSIPITTPFFLTWQ